MKYLLILLISVSCSLKKEKVEVETFKILINKNIEVVSSTAFNNGFTLYVLAFDDGFTVQTTFGYYSCLEIGDTIRFVKNQNNEDYWYKMKPNCK